MAKKLIALLLTMAVLLSACFCGMTAVAADSVKVTGVGIFDQSPNKGMHTFEGGSKVIQITFDGTFWTAAETATWVEWEESINTKLLINGKIPTDWIDASWGSVQIHVKKSDALGQYLEINLSDYEGLPSENTDSTIQILNGFAGTVAEDYTFKYTANNNVPYELEVEEAQPVAVTGVGIFDQTPNKGIHTFDNGSKVIQIKFDKDFWVYENATTNNGKNGNWVEWEESINTKLLINGRTPTDWIYDNGDASWGCVQIYVKKNDALGQYLEINFADYAGLPSETTDSTIQILSGFAGTVTEDYTFKYKANNNVPYALEGAEGVGVTGVGIFDQTPNKGIHTFDNGAKLIQITFDSDFWVYENAGTNDGKNGNYLEWEASINNYLLINGKKPQEWIGESWGSVITYAKRSDTLGQYLEINLSAIDGLPSETTDSTIKILSGFAGTVTKDYTFRYTANKNKPYTLKTANGVEVMGVGIFDQTPNKGIHTFDNGSKVIQIKFDEDFWVYENATTNDGKNGNWVEWEESINTKLLINGKTPTDWIFDNGDASWGCVQIYVKNSDALGQYLEINLKDYDGLPAEGENATIEILSGFAGTVLDDYTYQYDGEYNEPFVRNDCFITGVGVFDQTPSVGIHTYDSGRHLVYATFKDTFWGVDTQNWIQYKEFGLTDQIVVNGRTLSSWVDEYGDAAVFMHVNKSDALGQYLYMEFSNTVPGLLSPDSDNYITFLSDFPIYNKGTLGENVTFVYDSAANKPFFMKSSVSDELYGNKKEAGNYLIWDFENSAEGFTSNGGSISATNKALKYQATDSSVLYSEAGLQVPASKIRTLELRLKTNEATKLTVGWDRGNGFKDKNKATIDLTADGEYHEYQISFNTVSGWKEYIEQLSFTFDKADAIEIDQIRLVGMTISVFPWLTGNYDYDVDLLLTIKNELISENNVFQIGFSSLVEYMTSTDSNGNYAPNGLRSAEYLASLAKATGMPVTIWLRNDPWAEATNGVAAELYAVDNNVMWTQDNVAYRTNTTGYYHFCLAQNDINGNQTDYWTQTDKLLAQCAADVAKAIAKYPGYISSVTTTSEYYYATEIKGKYLDYNPNTIKEFRDYAKTLYGSISEFNAAYGTAFTTYELLSTDYDASTVENAGGFDAPRSDSNAAFAALWTEFRGKQINTALTRLVDIMDDYIDSKLIYTHQICGDSFTHGSPIWDGDVAGSNIGIDMHNFEATAENISQIVGLIGNDITRTWGVPEWIPTAFDGNAMSYSVLKSFVAAGAKFIGPFNYNSGDMYDIKNSESMQAIIDLIGNYGDNYTLGDVDENTTIDIRDLVRAKKHLYDSSVSVNNKAFDMDYNDSLDSEDIKEIRKVLIAG